MMTLERRRDLITVLVPYFLPKRLHSTKSYFIKAIEHTFYGFTGVITHAGCWENTSKACKSLAFGSWFTSFSSVLPTSRVGYHAGKPIESVLYCLTDKLMADETKTVQMLSWISLKSSCQRRSLNSELECFLTNLKLSERTFRILDTTWISEVIE